MIPKKFHFIFLVLPVNGKDAKPFCLYHYLSIKSCYDTQDPESITIYIDGPEPEDNEYWNSAKKYANVEYYNFKREINGETMPNHAAISNLARVEIVYERGGVYYDIDTLFLKDLKPFLNTNKCLVPWEYLSDGSQRLMTGGLLAPAGSEFLKIYLTYAHYILKGWGIYTGEVTTALRSKYPELVSGVILNGFGRNTWDDQGRIMLYENNVNFSQSYVIDLCQKVAYEPFLKHIRESDIFEKDTTFNVAARQFLERPKNVASNSCNTVGAETMLNELTAIMPVKIDSTDRLENLLVVSEYVTKRLHVPLLYVVEVDDEPKLFNFFKDNDRIRYVFVQRSKAEVWCKGRSFNTVLPWIESKAIAVWDTDTIIPGQSLQTAYENIVEGDADIAMPYSIFYHLHRKFIRDAKYGEFDFSAVNDPRNYDHAFDQVIGGGICLYRTSFLRHIRGFSELFRGWGAEDDEVVARAQKLGAKVIRVGGPLAHFFHERTPSCVPHEHHKKYNIAERARMISWDADTIAEYMGITKKVGKYSTLRDPEEPDEELAKLMEKQPLD